MEIFGYLPTGEPTQAAAPIRLMNFDNLIIHSTTFPFKKPIAGHGSRIFAATFQVRPRRTIGRHVQLFECYFLPANVEKMPVSKGRDG